MLVWLCIPLQGIGQDSLKNKNQQITPVYKSNNSNSVQSIRNVEASMKKGNLKDAAAEWETLGDNFSYKKQYEKSNEYYNKALKLYKKQKNKSRQATLYRKIALNNEALNKKEEAVSSYSAAKNLSSNSEDKRQYTNDISRVAADKEQHAYKYIEDNIELMEAADKPQEEVAQAYRQKAGAALAQKDTALAIKSLKQASDISDVPAQKIAIKEELAELYAGANSLQDAIATTRSNIARAREENDVEHYYKQYQQLAKYYFQSKETVKGIQVLEAALEEAYMSNNTQAAAAITEQLFSHYNSVGRQEQANQYAYRFLNTFEHIITNDSFLLQNKLFDEISKRVSVLEQEKETQTLLYAQTKTFNLVLMVLLGLTLLTIAGIVWFLYKLRKKNLQILLQSLRREMNPHFIFNSLNSVNQFIAENNEIAANKYLTRYATLMRNIMTTSNKNFITLNEEIETIKHYVSLEALRFSDQFEYQIDIDERIDTYHTLVPNMILQPFIENAIWHGLRYKDGKGRLTIRFEQEEGHLFKAVITDDGIGVAASKNIKTKNQQTYKSRGIKNTSERIATLNKLYGCNIQYTTAALITQDGSGTVVTLSWQKIKDYATAKN